MDQESARQEYCQSCGCRREVEPYLLGSVHLSRIPQVILVACFLSGLGSLFGLHLSEIIIFNMLAIFPVLVSLRRAYACLHCGAVEE